MKVINPKIEARVLVSIFDKRFTNAILSKVAPEDFGFPPALTVFQRIQAISITTGKLPTLDDFLEGGELLLPPDALSFLKRNRKLSLKKESDVRRALHKLDEFRKRRIISNMGHEIANRLQDEESVVDVDDLYTIAETAVRNGRTRHSTDVTVLSYGAGADPTLANKLLLERMNSPGRNIIPSGINNFDSIAGGFSPSHLLIVGASRGSGKTSFVTQLGSNFYFRFHFNVAYLHLEMDENACTDRVLANRTRIDSNRIRRMDLSNDEKDKILSAHRHIHRHGQRNMCRFESYILSSISPSKIDALVGHLGYDVVIIDYLGLIDNDKQQNGRWRTDEIRADITRKLKQFAKARNCLVVLVVQLNDDMRVSYSKAVENHVDWFFAWDMSEVAKELGVVKIHQGKARHTEKFSFLVKHELPYHQWTDYKGKDPFEQEANNQGNRRNGRQRPAPQAQQFNDGYGEVDIL